MSTQPGTPDGSALGFERPWEGPDPLADDADTARPEASDQEPSAPSPDPTPVEGTPGEGEPEGAGSEQAGEQLYAGRYRSVEDLERAYKEAQGWATRESQQAKAYQAQMTELQSKFAEQEKMLTELGPVITQLLAEQNPEAAETLEAREQLNRLVEERVAPMRAEMEQQQRQQEVVAVVSAFRAAHPDVPAGSPQDFEVAQTAQALDLNTGRLDSLEIAYEAWRWPGLRQVLTANPSLVDTDEGLEYARMQAKQFFGPPPTGAAPGASSQAGTPGQQAPAAGGTQQRAFVETGGTGAPASSAPGAKPPADEFDEAFDSWASERKSPLFGGRFPAAK